MLEEVWGKPIQLERQMYVCAIVVVVARVMDGINQGMYRARYLIATTY